MQKRRVFLLQYDGVEILDVDFLDELPIAAPLILRVPINSAHCINQLTEASICFMPGLSWLAYDTYKLAVFDPDLIIYEPLGL